MEQNKRLVLHVRLRCGSMSITTPVSLLANEFDVRIVLQWQVSLADVNQICVNLEALNGFKNQGLFRKCKYNKLCKHLCHIYVNTCVIFYLHLVYVFEHHKVEIALYKANLVIFVIIVYK